MISGIRPGKGKREGSIGSLLRALTTRLEPRRTDRTDVEGVPPADAADALWVRPELVGEVEFADWTPGGILRHSRWRGLRPDKTPDEVRRES